MEPSELYPVEKLGNCKGFEQWLMSQVEKENERGKVNHWRRFLEIYFAQLTFIQIDPSSEQYESVEMYPTIKRIERNVSDRFKGKIYRWGIEQVKIGHYRILYTVYDHYKILLLHVFEKDYGGLIRKEDIKQAEQVLMEYLHEYPSDLY